jgi:hypothetical protein
MPKSGLVDLDSLRWDSRARCLPLRGFLCRPSLLASNTSWGALRAWLELWPCTGASLVVPDSVTRGQLSNPGRGPAFIPSRFISGCLLSFEVWLSTAEPPSLVRVRSIRVLAVFYRFDSHAPFLGKREEGWGTSFYPRLGEFRWSPVSY